MRKVIVGVVAALALTAVGDGVAVAHLRSVERAEQVERAALAADTAYRDAVVSIAERLRLARAPIADVDSLFETESVEDVAPGVSFDVLVYGAVTADLDELRQALVDVQPPGDRVETHGRLIQAVEGLRAAAQEMADPAVDEIGPGLADFARAGGNFDRAVARDLDEKVDVVRTDAIAPDQLTRAGVLYRWSLVCARTLAELDALPEAPDDDAAATADVVDTEADALRRTVDVLLAPGEPPRDAAQLERDVRSPLRAVLPVADTLREFAAALRAGDAEALTRTLVALDLADASFEAASRGLQAYGATSCAVLLDPGVLLEGELGPGDDTATT